MTIEELKALEQSVPGGWGYGEKSGELWRECGPTVAPVGGPKAAELICALRNLAPQLLALVEAQIGLKYANGVWTGAKVLEARLDALMAKLTQL